MKISPATNAVPRVRVNALFSETEAAALQKLLESLTEEDYRKLADSDDEAAAFLQAANKMRRQLNAAEDIPAMPDYDD